MNNLFSWQAEISLCRVYKRAGVEDHPSLPRSLPTRASSSRGTHATIKKLNESTSHSIENFQAFVGNPQQMEEKLSETSGSSSTDIGASLGLSKHNNTFISLAPMTTTLSVSAPTSLEDPDDPDRVFLHHQPKQPCSTLAPDNPTIFAGPSFVPSNTIDDLHRLVNFQNASLSHHQQQYHNNPNHSSQLFSTLQAPPLPQSSSLALNMLPGSLQAAFTDRLWDWNSINEASKDFNSPFK